MTNEIAERKVYADFTPAILEITNFEELEKEVSKYVKKYHGLVFDASEEKEAKQARSELLSLHNALEEERKKIKRVYNQPLEEFESKIKDLTAVIDEPLNDIRSGLKEIEESQKQARQEALNEYLSKQVEDIDLSPEEIPQDTRWLNKGSWTATMNPTSKLVEEIESVIDAVLKEKERKASELKMLETFCASLDVDPSGWISQLEHRSATEVMDLINMDIKRKKEIALQQEKKKEQHENFMKQQEEVQKEAESFVAQVPEQKEEPKITDTIRVTGTTYQLGKLNDFLIAYGIEVERVENKTDSLIDITEDDLPW